MDRIEKLLSSHKTPIDYPTGGVDEVFELSKDDIKELIKLVVMEQKKYRG